MFYLSTDTLATLAKFDTASHPAATTLGVTNTAGSPFATTLDGGAADAEFFTFAVTLGADTFFVAAFADFDTFFVGFATNSFVFTYESFCVAGETKSKNSNCGEQQCQFSHKTLLV